MHPTAPYEVSLSNWIKAKSNDLYKSNSDYRISVDIAINWITSLINEEKCYDV